MRDLEYMDSYWDTLHEGFSPEVIRFTDNIILEGEKDFEQNILKKFPYKVELPYIVDLDQAISRIETITAWCQTHLHPNSYACFPNSAIGRYRECSNTTCFFSSPEFAMKFKLNFF